MAVVTITTTWSDGQTLTAAALNVNFSNLLNAPGIVNADIAGGAAIAVSKIATGLSGSLVGTTDTQTLSGKTLTKPIINGSVNAYTTDSDGATITFDMTASNIHTVTLGANRTLAVSNVTTGQAFVIILLQDGSGSRTVTWWSSIKWVAATVPTLTTTASRYDIFAFIYDGTNYYGSIVGLNFG